MKPRITLITVCYNAEQNLEHTLRSVAAQTSLPAEYIVIDGASTDGTLPLLAQYSHVVTHVVSEPDHGIYHAMNKGLALATGQYLCFLNAGDALHSAQTLELVARCAQCVEGGADVVYGDTLLVDAQRQVVGYRHLAPPRHLTWRSFRKGMTVCHQAFYAKRTLCQPYNLNYRFSADFDWCIRLLKQAHTTVNAHHVLVDYLHEGVTTRNHRASLWERFHIMRHHYGTLTTLCMHLWFLFPIGRRLRR